MNVSESIEKLVPYKPGKSIAETKKEYNVKEVYKLASNESPVGTSPNVIKAIQSALTQIHRYPDPNCTEFKKLIAEKVNLKTDQIVVGNGSNELIDLLIRTFCVDGDKILTSKSAFIAYKICATAASVSVVETPLNKELQFDIPVIINESKNSNFKIIFVANPNNPTGTYINEQQIKDLLLATQNQPNTLVVLDEAYNEFVRVEDFPDSEKLLKEFDHLVVLKTLSKVYGLAGVRIGYILANANVCDYINRIRNPFNVNALAQAAGIAALKDNDFLSHAKKVNWEGLDYFYSEFTKMNVTYWPSQANFILIDVKHDSSLIFEALLHKGVITRPVKAYGLSTHLRVSVGKESENKIAVNEIKKVLNEFSSNN